MIREMGAKDRTFFLKTLGCKVNQVESAYLAERLIELGFRRMDEESAEVFILNSCAVTERSVAEAKRLVRSWIRKRPKRIVVGGCTAVSFKEDFFQLAKTYDYPHLLLLGQKAKLNPRYYLEPLSNHLPQFIEDEEEAFFLCKNFLQRSRAFLKIQDGCSSFCSYCIVPYTRGPSRSLPEEIILSQAQLFLEQGYREIVITGIHIGHWGKDLSPPRTFPYLLRRLEELVERSKQKVLLRLSSLEVSELDKEFFDLLKETNHLCPHFHIPLQSGSNRILKLMNRAYTKEEYLERIFCLKELYPLATFGADVIVGFPSETEEDFQETLKVIEDSPLNWLHVFPFSPRPGTPAAGMPGKIPEKIVKHRSELLRRVGEVKRQAFLKDLIGRIFWAIIEDKERGPRILLENYVHAELEEFFPLTLELKRGDLLKVRIKKIENGLVWANFLGRF